MPDSPDPARGSEPSADPTTAPAEQAVLVSEAGAEPDPALQDAATSGVKPGTRDEPDTTDMNAVGDDGQVFGG